MKEFLDNLYKQCASRVDSGIDALFDVLPALLGERKFAVVDSILANVDLPRLDTSTMYAIINLSSPYIHQLDNYRSAYKRIREEFARRGESSKHIADLFDQFEDGCKLRMFDPNAPPYKTTEERDHEKLAKAIARAKEFGDQEIVDYLNYYQGERARYRERDHEFHNLRHMVGHEELRTRTIKSLREMADLLENNAHGFPDVYYCKLPDDPLLKKTFIDGIEVIISYPWPG